MKSLKILFFLVPFVVFSQVGLNTSSPEGVLDIVSSNTGVLLPRIALSSNADNTTIINPNGGPIADGTIVYNTGTGGLTPAGIFIFESGSWALMTTDREKQIHFGTITITSSGSVSVTGVGFEPSSVEFVAINRVQTANEGASRSGQNNSNDIRMAGGMTTGFAQNNGGAIDQYAMATGLSGSSINNIGTYSSTNHCFAALFVNNNGEPIHDNGSATGGTDTQEGLIRASMTSFDTDGFTINVDRFLAGSSTNSRENQIVVMYKAYR
ncbi:lysyl-tRNA synthetase [Nonlabens sp. MIC269]|uniref:hypothetical protein n=1 Tax=Nonlabens sp. MIC269 TaxID=1476901 RepID=UPI000720EF6B|nr:hypothetical protein [Nonlabens sp. MIC269]ALM20878.1 lysyl-tRNA synthetase [Nonlabens sp. MIC269]